MRGTLEYDYQPTWAADDRGLDKKIEASQRAEEKGKKKGRWQAIKEFGKRVIGYTDDSVALGLGRFADNTADDYMKPLAHRRVIPVDDKGLPIPGRADPTANNSSKHDIEWGEPGDAPTAVDRPHEPLTIKWEEQQELSEDDSSSKKGDNASTETKKILTVGNPSTEAPVVSADASWHVHHEMSADVWTDSCDDGSATSGPKLVVRSPIVTSDEGPSENLPPKSTPLIASTKEQPSVTLVRPNAEGGSESSVVPTELTGSVPVTPTEQQPEPPKRDRKALRREGRKERSRKTVERAGRWVRQRPRRLGALVAATAVTVGGGSVGLGHHDHRPVATLQAEPAVESTGGPSQPQIEEAGADYVIPPMLKKPEVPQSQRADVVSVASFTVTEGQGGLELVKKMAPEVAPEDRAAVWDVVAKQLNQINPGSVYKQGDEWRIGEAGALIKDDKQAQQIYNAIKK